METCPERISPPGGGKVCPDFISPEFFTGLFLLPQQISEVTCPYRATNQFILKKRLEILPQKWEYRLAVPCRSVVLTENSEVASVILNQVTSNDLFTNNWARVCVHGGGHLCVPAANEDRHTHTHRQTNNQLKLSELQRSFSPSFLRCHFHGAFTACWAGRSDLSRDRPSFLCTCVSERGVHWFPLGATN